MDDPPFENLFGLLAQVRDELIPAPMALAIQALQADDVPYPTDEERRPLLYSVRSMRTEQEFRSWLHLEAEIVDMIELSAALLHLSRFFLNASATDQRALKLMREIVPSPTLTNIARIAVREWEADREPHDGPA